MVTQNNNANQILQITVPRAYRARVFSTYLFALLDDCSRLCVHGQFYEHERLEGFLDALRRALQTRGLPEKLYTDNGAAFRSQHLAVVCANLGIRLIHAKPYHSWSKGKIERFFSTVQTPATTPQNPFKPISPIRISNHRPAISLVSFSTSGSIVLLSAAIFNLSNPFCRRPVKQRQTASKPWYRPRTRPPH
jgi:transposase InsO family protein